MFCFKRCLLPREGGGVDRSRFFRLSTALLAPMREEVILLLVRQMSSLHLMSFVGCLDCGSGDGDPPAGALVVDRSIRGNLRSGKASFPQTFTYQPVAGDVAQRAADAGKAEADACEHAKQRERAVDAVMRFPALAQAVSHGCDDEPSCEPGPKPGAVDSPSFDPVVTSEQDHEEDQTNREDRPQHVVPGGDEVEVSARFHHCLLSDLP